MLDDDSAPSSGRGPEAPRVGPTSAAAITTCVVLGLVGGWALRPLTQRYADSSPLVSWSQVAALALVAAFLAAVAWSTRRTIARRQLLEPHRAVNRLVLAKACALVGALAAGGYAGYAVAWLGMAAELADERTLHSGLAALAGAAMCVAALLLERACRVREDDPDA